MPKRSKNRNMNKQECSVKFILQGQLSAEELQHTIANAIIEAEEIKKQREKEQQDKEAQERLATIGYKEYSQSNVLIRRTSRFLNDVKVLFKITFLPKSKIKGDIATSTLMRMALSILFGMIRIGLLIISLSMIAYIPIQCFLSGVTPVSWIQNITLALYALAIFILSQMFRMASIEVEKSDDNNFLFSVLASVTSIVSIVIAIIALVK